MVLQNGPGRGPIILKTDTKRQRVLPAIAERTRTVGLLTEGTSPDTLMSSRVPGGSLVFRYALIAKEGALHFRSGLSRLATVPSRAIAKINTFPSDSVVLDP